MVQPSKVISLMTPGATRAAQGPGTINLDRVSVTFGRGEDALKALDDVTLEVHDGDFIGLSARPAAASRRSSSSSPA